MRATSCLSLLSRELTDPLDYFSRVSLVRPTYPLGFRKQSPPELDHRVRFPHHCFVMPSLYHARAAQALGERRWPRSQSGWPRWACPSTRVRADLCRERHRFFAPSRSDRPTPQGPRRLLPRASAEDAARYRGACRYAGGPRSAPSGPEACSSRNRRAPPAHRDVLRRCGLQRVIRQARPRRPPSRAIHASFGWTVPTLVDESLSLTLSGPFSRPDR
jgi:hypothetical protein